MPGQQMKWIGPRYRETIETLWINYSVHAVLQHLYSPHISVGSSTKYMNSTEVCDCVLGHRPPCGVNYIEGRGWLLKNTCIHHHFHLLSGLLFHHHPLHDQTSPPNSPLISSLQPRVGENNSEEGVHHYHLIPPQLYVTRLPRPVTVTNCPVPSPKTARKHLQKYQLRNSPF